MNEIIIPGLYLLSGISVYASISHLSFGLQRPFDLTHIMFAGLCLLLVPFAISHILTLQATSVGEYVAALKWTLAMVFLFLTLFLWFIARYTGKRPLPLLVGLSMLFATLFVFNLTQPYSLQYDDISGLRTLRMPWGEVLTRAVGHNYGGWFHIAIAGVLLAFGYALYALGSLYRRNRNRATLGMLFAIGVFLISAIQGVLVRLSIIDFIELGPFGYLGMIIVMSVVLNRESQQRLRTSENRFRSLVEQAPFSIQILAQDARTLQVNAAWEKLWGVKSEAIAGYNILEDQQLVEKGVMQHIEQGLAGVASEIPPIVYNPADNPVVRGPTRDRWIRAYIYPIKNEAGEIREAILIHEDVTEKKRIEDAIHLIAAGVAADTGELFFQQLVQSLVRVFDADYAFIGLLDKKSASPQVNTIVVCAYGEILPNMSYPLTGTPCANVVGQQTCAHPDHVQELFPEDKLLVQMGANSYIGTPLFDSRGEPLGLIVILDEQPMRNLEQVDKILKIFAARSGAELERMQVEKTLRDSEAGLAEAQRISHIGNWELDLVTNQLEWSDEIYRIFEINPSKFGATYEAFLDEIHPDDRERVNIAYTEPLKNKMPYNIEHRLRMPNGTIKHVQERFETFYDDTGRPLSSVGTVQDITERVIMEESLHRAQKMEIVGQLSGGIAHDFNNQLGIIIGFLDILKNDIVHDEEALYCVGHATKATLRCIDLTRQLLSFSRVHSKEKVVADLNGLLKDLETMIERSVTPEIEVQYFLTDELWRTEIDPGEFQDVILNLVINARDAMPGSGKLLIETTNKHLDTGYTTLNSGVEAGDYVLLMLSDTGSGISADTLKHIFDPFFTTKPEGEGTGLGMTMVYGFAKRNGGNIKVYSEPGVGTTIRLYLPRSTVSVATVQAKNDLEELPTGHESILIVDDEVELLHLADQYLSDLGYRTHLAETVAQALELLARDENIDLLFSDVVMPGGMNGYELAQQATQQRHNLKVLLTSGFTSKTMVHNGLARFSSHLLSKPYRKDDLAQHIRLVLDEESVA